MLVDLAGIDGLMFVPMSVWNELGVHMFNFNQKQTWNFLQ